jgi:lipopolysaccharide transport system ATP-binding protein
MGGIHVSNLGKAYKQYPNRWARVAEWFLGRKRHHLHWVLQDVSFTVLPGEAVGIVGVNGAGKSTLLKMITGTTQPTTGSVVLTGRVAALLELGMGFHPDFTGRQNVYMAGQLMGYTEAELTELMPSIEEFAEIGTYMDQPIRVYSSGMQMRVAFALAVARRPDILIVDEALSVGDVFFQHKCFERIRQFAADGTTLLIVSHDKQAIQSICDRAILLNGGKVAFEGEPEAVMDYYNALVTEAHKQWIRQEQLAEGKTRTISGTGEAVVTDIVLLDDQDRPVVVVEVGQPLTLKVTVEAREPVERLIFGWGIRDRLGQVLYGTNTELTEQPLHGVAQGTTTVYRVQFPANLGVGGYSIVTALVHTGASLDKKYEWRDRALMFEVVNGSKSTFVGCMWMDSSIQIATA